MVLPKWLKKQTDREISNDQEKSVAKSVKGRTTIASGALHFDKGDVVGSGFRGECKVTRNKSYSLKLEELHKIKDHAHRQMETPIFVVGFLNNDTNKREDYVVLRKEDFMAQDFNG